MTEPRADEWGLGAPVDAYAQQCDAGTGSARCVLEAGHPTDHRYAAVADHTTLALMAAAIVGHLIALPPDRSDAPLAADCATAVRAAREILRLVKATP